VLAWMVMDFPLCDPPHLVRRYLRQWALLEKKAGNREVAADLFAASARRNPLVSVCVCCANTHSAPEIFNTIQTLHNPLVSV